MNGTSSSPCSSRNWMVSGLIRAARSRSICSTTVEGFVRCLSVVRVLFRCERDDRCSRSRIASESRSQSVELSRSILVPINWSRREEDVDQVEFDTLQSSLVVVDVREEHLVGVDLRVLDAHWCDLHRNLLGNDDRLRTPVVSDRSGNAMVETRPWTPKKFHGDGSARWMEKQIEKSQHEQRIMGLSTSGWKKRQGDSLFFSSYFARLDTIKLVQQLCSNISTVWDCRWDVGLFHQKKITRRTRKEREW